MINGWSAGSGLWFDEEFEVVKFADGMFAMKSGDLTIFIKNLRFLFAFGSFVPFGHNGRVFLLCLRAHGYHLLKGRVTLFLRHRSPF